MFTPTRPIHRCALAWTAALLAFASLAVAQGCAIAQSQPADTQPAYTQPELDRLLAPIALYPDPLLSQILMASTYPIEVVEAARWSRANPGLRGDAAVRAVEDRDWEPSVKSLVAFPDVLARMDENLEWTRQLGDAFLAQEAQVMETVQQLRQRARAAGTLVTDTRIGVVDDGRMIVVQPADPRVVYVPYYDPRVAYGTWWWPAYPPVVWAPWPAYAVRYPQPRPGVAVGLLWGPAVRVSVGFFFGAIDWPRREVRIVSVDNYYYRPAIVRREVHVHDRVTQIKVVPGPWRHDPWHRRGATYRAPEVQRRFAPAAPPREAPRSGERRPDAVRPRAEPNPPVARPAQGEQVERASPRGNERAEVRPNGPSQDRRTELRKPGNDPSRTATPAAAPPPEKSAAPIARDQSRREPRQAQRRPNTASPRPGAPSPSASAAPVAREANRGDARDHPGRQERRADARTPAERDQRQRDTGSERAPRGQRQPPEPQAEPPR